MPSETGEALLVGEVPSSGHFVELNSALEVQKWWLLTPWPQLIVTVQECMPRVVRFDYFGGVGVGWMEAGKFDYSVYSLMRLCINIHS